MAAKAKQADAEEADAEADGEGEAAPAKRKLSLKLIVIIAAAAVAVLGAGGAGAFLLFGGKSTGSAGTQVKTAVFVDVPEVLVNLASAGSDRTHYLKVKIVLELPDPAVQPKVQTVMPRVMDAFQTFLRELRPSDLDGSAGLYRLKEELTRRVNAAISPSRITAVLFKEIVVQ
jgi:flagellar FliL protein